MTTQRRRRPPVRRRTALVRSSLRWSLTLCMDEATSVVRRRLPVFFAAVDRSCCSHEARWTASRSPGSLVGHVYVVGVDIYQLCSVCCRRNMCFYQAKNTKKAIGGKRRKAVLIPRGTPNNEHHSGITGRFVDWPVWALQLILLLLFV